MLPVTAPFRCATCVFFSPHQPNWTDRPTGRGQCRRHAPVLDKEADGRLRTLWPMVHEDNYCGEHAEVEVPVDEDQVRPKQPPAERAPLPLGPQWRCVNCKEIEVRFTEPEKCATCLCRQFARVDA